MKEDYVNKIIKDHHSRFNNFDIQIIKKYFSEGNRVVLDDEVLIKRIEKIKNETSRPDKEEN
jgi:hypothetical protein